MREFFGGEVLPFGHQKKKKEKKKGVIFRPKAKTYRQYIQKLSTFLSEL
jgi:hypothetical protein